MKLPLSAVAILKNGIITSEQNIWISSFYFRLLFLRRVIPSDLFILMGRSVAQLFYRHCS